LARSTASPASLLRSIEAVAVAVGAVDHLVPAPAKRAVLGIEARRDQLPGHAACALSEHRAVLELVDLLAAPERRQVAAVKLCGQSHTRLRQDGGHDVDQRHGLLDPHVRWDALASHELASGLMRLALHRVRSERTGSRQ
jgi:hypothetical protein